MRKKQIVTRMKFIKKLFTFYLTFQLYYCRMIFFFFKWSLQHIVHYPVRKYCKKIQFKNNSRNIFNQHYIYLHIFIVLFCTSCFSPQIFEYNIFFFYLWFCVKYVNGFWNIHIYVNNVSLKNKNKNIVIIIIIKIYK